MATSLKLCIGTCRLQTVLKAGRWSGGSFNLRDVYPQADSLQKTGPLVAAGGVVSPPACLAIVICLTPSFKGGGCGGPKVPRETPEP